MEAIPSIGLLEILLIATVAGLALFVMAVIAVLVVACRRKEAESPEAETGKPAIGKWILVFGLSFLLALPLCVVAGGVMVVMPARSARTVIEGSSPEIVMLEANSRVIPATVTMPEVPPSDPAVVAPSQPSAGSLSLRPGEISFLVLPGLAGLFVLLGAAIMVGLGRSRSPDASQMEDNGDNGDRPAWLTRVKLGFLALTFWFALSVFFILDVNFAVSVYLEFVVIYGGFWILVGALLLVGRPARDKLLILGLFALLLFSVQFVNWNSRKPFLRSFHRIDVGMSASQVEQIMLGYMKDYGGGPPGSWPQTQFDDEGAIVNGSATFRHTREGWGDSDWGVVTFEDGRVVETRFLPD
jgi:hypothetical protein